MREIKFRGKMIPENEWIYGTLLRIPAPPYCWGENPPKDKYYIQFADPRYMPDWGLPYKMVQGEVNPETIGQYTGLKDKNGKEIYEGDIIQDDFYEQKTEVVFLEGAFWLDYKEDFEKYGTQHKKYQLIGNYDSERVLEVIGTIYDNPELLEE